MEVWLGHGCSSHRTLMETNGIMVWTGCSNHRILLKRTELWFGHGCSSHCILLEHERNYGLGMDAPVTVFSWNTNGIMVWTGCSSHRILVETNGIMVWTGCSSHRILLKRTELWFGHGCSSHCILLEHERNYGLGMDAPVTVFSWNTNGIMVGAWMLQSPYSFGTRTELWFGLDALVTVFSKNERNYGLGMDAPVTVFSGNTNGIMLGAWMP